jgi:hypothetical protein
MEKSLVTGKAAKTFIKNMEIKILPTDWKSNKKAWMTSCIMVEWQRALNAKLKQEKPNVLLFLDNTNISNVSQHIDQGVMKCVKLNYCKVLTQSLLANMEAASPATQIAKFISVLDAVIWLAEAAKQESPQMVHRCFQRAQFSTELNDDETDERNIQELNVSLYQATYENVKAQDYLDTDAEVEKEAVVKEIDKFITNHQQSKER